MTYFMTRDQIGQLPSVEEESAVDLLTPRGLVAARSVDPQDYTEEQVLFAELVEQAVTNAREGCEHARSWIASERFDAVCECIRIDASYVRRKLREEGKL